MHNFPFLLLPFLFVGGAILLLLGIVVAASYAEKKRREQLQAVANQLGLPFYPVGDPQLIAELSHFPLFSQGRSKKIANMLHGDTDEVDVGIFDYQYTTGGGKHSHTWIQTIVYFNTAKLNLPDFALRPEHLFHKIGGALGYQDIDFETHPQFSKMFLLRGSGEQRIRNLFRDDLLAALERLSGISIEGHGPRLIFYRAAKRATPEQIRSLMEEGFKVYTLFLS